MKLLSEFYGQVRKPAILRRKDNCKKILFSDGIYYDLENLVI